MKKKILVLLITMLTAASALTGCSSKATTKPQGDGKDTTTAKETEKETTTAEKPVELIWLMGDPGKVPPEQAMVEEKLDEISVKELNVKVKTLYYDNDKTMLALSSGEKWDMAFTCEWFNNFAVQARTGYFADITEKIKTLTPELYATMPEIVWEGAKIDGKIMAIPVKKDYAAELFWRFDKKLFVEKLGMDIPKNMNFDAAGEYLAAAKKAYEDGVAEAADAQYPFKINKGGVAGVDYAFDMINRDVMLGIPYSSVGTADSDKIVLTAEHPDLSKVFKTLHQWYEAGYINPDAATTEETFIYSSLKNGQGFYGADAIWSSGDGYNQVISKYSGPYLSTASIRGSMNAINANSEHVDLALKYQQLVNTNKQYRDILRYGVEGTHFNYTENGLVKRTERGVNNYGPWAFSQGSYSLSSVEASDGVDVDPKMWDVIFDGYKDLVATNTIGFSFDITPVADKVAVCKVIRDKFWTGLITGATDPEVEIPKMIKELEAAGIRDIQAEAQKQFDAFLEASKK
jgi:putative aldouronate transport system substrate-binding protein